MEDAEPIFSDHRLLLAMTDLIVDKNDGREVLLAFRSFVFHMRDEYEAHLTELRRQITNNTVDEKDP